MVKLIKNQKSIIGKAFESDKKSLSRMATGYIKKLTSD